MSYRVNKYIGYGFDDLVENDPRVDFDLFEERMEVTHEEFDNFVQIVKTDENDYKIYNLQKGANKPWTMYEKAIYDDEYGLKNVMLFIHPMSEDWHRCDDIIDYVEEVSFNGTTQAEIKRLSSGIHPYNVGTRKYHIPSGEFLTANQILRLQGLKGVHITSNGDEIGTYKDIKNDLVPEIPMLIRKLAEFAGVKTKYLNDMRPLIYKMWR